MDGVTVIRVVRQIRIVTLQPATTLPVTTQPATAPPTIVQPSPQKNNICLNAFVLLIIYIVGIGSIVLGGIHLNNCPAQYMLPAGLIAFGGMLMVSRLLNCVYDCRSVCEEERSENIPTCLEFLNVLFWLSEFGLFIAICCWAFSMNPTTKPEDRALLTYCDNTLYQTSFYGCIIGLIFYGLPIFCGCCIVCCTLPKALAK